MKLVFNIEGKYITELARSWLYEEKRPFGKVKELLLSCMCGTNHSNQQLEKYVDDVLTFKKRFEGNTKDNTFCLTEETNIRLPNYIKTKNLEHYYFNIKNNIQNKFDICPYGFINPQGEYIPVEWCKHSKWANDYIQEHYTIEQQLTGNPESYIGTDYLIYIKNWILIDSPTQDEGRVQIGNKITKAQKETLYDYFIFFNRIEEANKLYEED